MRVAVVGAGISGLLTAWILRGVHDVVLYEAAGVAGGHTHTVDVETPRGVVGVDTGFIVYNERTYPLFTRLLAELGVETAPSVMSFSVRSDGDAIEYRGSSLGSLFARRSELLRPRLWRLLRDVLRFHRRAPRLLEREGGEIPLGELLDEGRYSRVFVERYIVPMAAAVWSAPPSRIREFPARTFVRFFQNHGFLQVRDRPTWRVVVGGSRRYVDRLAADLGARLRLSAPVAGVSRQAAGGVSVRVRGEEARTFDHVVLACHSDQALALLEDATPAEKEVLGAIPYQRNEAVLHTDPSWMPRRARAWASWNYRIAPDPEAPATVTYHMNCLQGLPPAPAFFVTLNPSPPVEASHVLRRITWHHPGTTLATHAAQARREEISGVRGTWFAGAYWGYGFHEDGARSARDVATALGGSW